MFGLLFGIWMYTQMFVVCVILQPSTVLGRSMSKKDGSADMMIMFSLSPTKIFTRWVGSHSLDDVQCTLAVVIRDECWVVIVLMWSVFICSTHLFEKHLS